METLIVVKFATFKLNYIKGLLICSLKGASHFYLPEKGLVIRDLVFNIKCFYRRNERNLIEIYQKRLKKMLLRKDLIHACSIIEITLLFKLP